MEFTLRSTQDTFYEKFENPYDYEKIGFTVEYKDIPILAKYGKVFTISGNPIIEINTIEDIVELVEKFGDLIIGKGSIEIYNGYRE